MEDISARFHAKYNIIGESQQMKELYREIELVAPGDKTVFIRGERGTGKELVARAIHEESPRNNGPYVVINCSTIQPTLLESELFGHEKGAFTDAHKLKRGRFERAEGGTLFLDEIPEMGMEVQPKLLRALEYKEFERVGGEETRVADVRLITATSKDIENLIEERKFRHDLYDRINVFPLYVPPLRERGDDIKQLAFYFIEKNQGNGIEPEALEMLTSYGWPGNVRELKSVIERLVLRSGGRKITPPDIERYGMLARMPRLPQYHPLEGHTFPSPADMKEFSEKKIISVISQLKAAKSYLQGIREFEEGMKKAVPGIEEELAGIRKLLKGGKWDQQPAETREPVPLHTFCKASGITYAAIYGALRKGYIKHSVKDSEIRVSIPELDRYFMKTHNEKAFSGMKRYASENPDWQSHEICINKRDSGGKLPAHHKDAEKGVHEGAADSEHIDVNLSPYKISRLAGMNPNTLPSAIRRDRLRPENERFFKYGVEGKALLELEDAISYFDRVGNTQAASNLQKHKGGYKLPAGDGPEPGAGEHVSALRLSKMLDIPASTIYDLSRRQFTTTPEERSLKCTVHEHELVTTIGDLSSYYKNKGRNQDTVRKLETYMKEHPESESLEIRIKRMPRD